MIIKVGERYRAKCDMLVPGPHFIGPPEVLNGIAPGPPYPVKITPDTMVKLDYFAQGMTDTGWHQVVRLRCWIEKPWGFLSLLKIRIQPGAFFNGFEILPPQPHSPRWLAAHRLENQLGLGN